MSDQSDTIKAIIEKTKHLLSGEEYKYICFVFKRPRVAIYIAMMKQLSAITEEMTKQPFTIRPVIPDGMKAEDILIMANLSRVYAETSLKYQKEMFDLEKQAEAIRITLLAEELNEVEQIIPQAEKMLKELRTERNIT